MTTVTQPGVMQDLERQHERLVRTLTRPTWPAVAVSQANRETEAAHTFADRNAAARASQYRRDPLKCAELLADWLHEPKGREAIAKLTGGDWCEYGNRCLVALDAACKTAAWQDLHDEHFLGESP